MVAVRVVHWVANQSGTSWSLSPIMITIIWPLLSKEMCTKLITINWRAKAKEQWSWLSKIFIDPYTYVQKCTQSRELQIPNHKNKITKTAKITRRTKTTNQSPKMQEIVIITNHESWEENKKTGISIHCGKSTLSLKCIRTLSLEKVAWLAWRKFV